MKPFVEISYMPNVFASGTSTTFHYQRQHLSTRYGIEEVSKWMFEVWNEPGNFEQYMALYTNTSKAIKSVNARLRVGGPATMRLNWIDSFVGNVTSQNIPIDFVSSHLYPSDPQINASEGVNAFYNYLVDNDKQLDC